MRKNKRTKKQTKPETTAVAMKPIVEEPFLTPAMQDREPPAVERAITRKVERDSDLKTDARELFNRENITLKTELSHNEINCMVRMEVWGEIAGQATGRRVRDITNKFSELRVSKDRKSRGEFVQVVNLENQNNTQRSVFDRLISGGGNT